MDIATIIGITCGFACIIVSILGGGSAGVFIHIPSMMIVVGGMFADGFEAIQPLLQKTIQDMAFADLGSKVSLKKTSFGWRAGVLGAASLALTNLFFQQPKVI